MLLLTRLYSQIWGSRGSRCRMGCNGRGPDRPAASTGNGLVTFRDVTRSLTEKVVYYDTRLNFARFWVKVRFSWLIALRETYDGFTTYRTTGLWINSEIRWISTLLSRVVACCGTGIAKLRCWQLKCRVYRPLGVCVMLPNYRVGDRRSAQWLASVKLFPVHLCLCYA